MTFEVVVITFAVSFIASYLANLIFALQINK